MVDLEPAVGAEANKTRPAILVSNDGANRSAERRGRGVLTVVPVTSNVRRVLPFQVMLRAPDCGLRVDSKAQVEQIRSVAIGRLGRYVGKLPPDTMRELEAAMRLQLDLTEA
jgi:mRNA interferase MazF